MSIKNRWNTHIKKNVHKNKDGQWVINTEKPSKLVQIRSKKLRKRHEDAVQIYNTIVQQKAVEEESLSQSPDTESLHNNIDDNICDDLFQSLSNYDIIAFEDLSLFQ